ncbi:MAG: aminotransferase class V-fold PLP-dependent enzyme [Candidatus Anstonellales archaeon]
MDTIRSDFPILSKYPRLIYLDNAATTHKPKLVIDALSEFYINYNANIHRGVYRLSEEATDLYERSREIIARFIGAEPYQIVFVKNATEALNTAIWNFRSHDIQSTVYEHHSMLLPIYRYSKSYKLHSRIEEIKGDIIAITHASNVTGRVIDLKTVRENNPNAIIIADGTQYVPHMSIDIKSIDIDMYAFSGHKMLGPTGIGVLYIKNPEQYEPLMLGGGTVSNVTNRMFRLLDTVERYEAGTPPIAEAYALSKAVEYLSSKFEDLHQLDQRIIRIANRLFQEYEIYPVEMNTNIPIFSFYFSSIHSHDVAEMLDTYYDIAVRSGYHCAQPLHEFLGIGPTVRASFHVYNTEEELYKFMNALKNIILKFK